MSENLKQLELKPPLAGLRNDGEVRKIKGFKCPSCEGLGYFVEGFGYHGSQKGEEIRTDCFRCEGTGNLYADVVIRWTPDKEKQI